MLAMSSYLVDPESSIPMSCLSGPAPYVYSGRERMRTTHKVRRFFEVTALLGLGALASVTGCGSDDASGSGGGGAPGPDASTLDAGQDSAPAATDAPVFPVADSTAPDSGTAGNTGTASGSTMSTDAAGASDAGSDAGYGDAAGGDSAIADASSPDSAIADAMMNDASQDDAGTLCMASCCPGPDASAYCVAKLGDASATCVNSACTMCPAATSSNYLVDPVGGNDVTGTGDNSTDGCGFKTITRALAVIGEPVVPTTITVLGPSTVGDAEVFPIALPADVTLTTARATVRVAVPAGRSGFTLDAPTSAIAGGPAGDGGSAPGLVVAGNPGGANAALFGIIAGGAGLSPANAPEVTNVVVESFLDDGIVVLDSGVLRIGAGVTSTANGTTGNRRNGLHVEGGQAIVDVSPSDAPTHFDGNTQNGIFVEAGGAINVAGSVSNPAIGVGTITANGNYAGGVQIQTNLVTPPMDAISGLVAFGNTNGFGFGFAAGSNVKLRNSVALGNQTYGVLVSAGLFENITQIDLGTAVDAGGTAGGNIFQDALGLGNNGAAGICLGTGLFVGGTLMAQGNTFGAVNCATTAAALRTSSDGCSNDSCSGGVCDLGIIGQGTIDVAMCTP